MEALVIHLVNTFMGSLLWVRSNGRRWVSKPEGGPAIISGGREIRKGWSQHWGLGGRGSCPQQALLAACLAKVEYCTGSILRRWKRNWFALWLDGTLGYYHDETAQDEEDRVLIQFNVRDIKIGQECQGEKPFSLWRCDCGLGPPTVCLMTPASGSLRPQRGFYRHCFWASIQLMLV